MWSAQIGETLNFRLNYMREVGIIHIKCKNLIIGRYYVPLMKKLKRERNEPIAVALMSV